MSLSLRDVPKPTKLFTLSIVLFVSCWGERSRVKGPPQLLADLVLAIDSFRRSHTILTVPQDDYIIIHGHRMLDHSAEIFFFCQGTLSTKWTTMRIFADKDRVLITYPRFLRCGLPFFNRAIISVTNFPSCSLVECDEFEKSI